MKIRIFSGLKDQKPSYGSILIEVLISILLLSFFIIGSVYSYSFVHQRIRRQLHRRVLLSAAQGWIEQTRFHLVNIARDTTLDPNQIMTSSFQRTQEGLLKARFDKESQDMLNLEPDMATIDIHLSNSENNFVNILITAELDGSPVILYTQISPDIHR
ncbi:hypothetical protein JXL19_04350 [bacterium]|nr:hypothetical protein [bacterium]